MDIDWERELDRAITAGGDRPPSDFVTPGRRALRRRRTFAGVASAAAVAVVLGVGASVGGAAGLVGGGATGAGFAVDGGPDAGEPVGERPDWSMSWGEPCRPREADQPAAYDGRGTLCLAEGVRVVERVDNPMGYPRAGSRSVGLVVEVDNTWDFVFAVWEGRGSTSVFSRSAVGSLQDWLDGQVAARRQLDDDDVSSTPAGWVSLDSAGRPVPGPGVEVVDSRAVDLGESFAPPDAPAWAVELEVGGQRELALVRRIDGSTDVIPGSRSFEDLDAFVADAREQYASGAGLL